MLVQIVRLETTLSDEELQEAMDSRIDDYRALPGLLQKYYVRLNEPNHYGGIMVWQDRAAFEAFRQSDLAKTVGAAYAVKGAPSVEVIEVMFPLRDIGVPEGAIAEVA